MRKAVCIWIGILSVFFLSFSAKADLIWEPEDSFYQKHVKECTNVNRQFTANGPDGRVIVYKSPELPQEVAVWENGYNVRIYFTYEDKDGILWGVYDDFQGNTGWIPMDYMRLVYDSISFGEEHADQITGDTGALDERYLGEEIFFWEYPGSEVYTFIKAENYMPEYYGIYEDANGNQWGNVRYYFGMKNVWVCIDSPAADFEQLFPEGVPEADRPDADWNAEETALDKEDETQQGIDAESGQSGSRKEDRITPKPDLGIVSVAMLLVILVAVVTVILLKRLKCTGKDKV